MSEMSNVDFKYEVKEMDIDIDDSWHTRGGDNVKRIHVDEDQGKIRKSLLRGSISKGTVVNSKRQL